MLQNVLRKILFKFLQCYVRNFNEKKVELGIWQGGRVDLENLELNTNVLDQTHLPFEVTKGLIGKATLQVRFS